MTSGPVVAIVAPATDLHARTVAWELERLGAEPVIVDLGGYPEHWQLTLGLDGRGGQTFRLVTREGRVLTDGDIAGLWWRRPAPFSIPDAVEDEQHRMFCSDECRSIIEGWMFGLGRRAMNPLAVERPSDNKPNQLATAAGCGLTIPRTLISNDPAAVRDFAATCGHDLIYKGLSGKPRTQMKPTKRVDAAALEQLDLLVSAPCIFQEAILGGLDIRVTVVDEAIFAAEIEIRSKGAAYDWRIDPNHVTRPHALPAEVAGPLIAFHKLMGLRYGAYDFRIDAAGVYRFLEVNPGGQYLWLETEAGHPISEAIAKALVEPPAA